MEDLGDKMDPEKVVNELWGCELLHKSDKEGVMCLDKTFQKNQKLVDIIQSRNFKTFSKFLHILCSIDEKHLALAEELQPVRFRILWFSFNQLQAAAVVHTLERYAGAAFTRMQRIGEGGSLILRRGRVFIKEHSKEELKRDPHKRLERYSHDVEVSLVFPSFWSDPISSLESCLKQQLFSQQLDMLVMGGVCEGSGEDGQGVVITKATQLKGVVEVCAKPMGIDLISSDFSHIVDVESSWINNSLCNRLGNLQITPCPMDSRSGKEAQFSSDQQDASMCGCSEANVVFDPTVFNFYGLCREYFPKARSVVCLGSLPRVAAASPCRPTQEVEGIVGYGRGVELAAMTSARALMNIIHYYYTQANMDE